MAKKVNKPKFTKPPLPKKAAAVVKFLPPWESGEPGPKRATVEQEERTAYDFSHVSEKTKALRKLFVTEFAKDFNGAAALLRLGMEYTNPGTVANQWLREPYTQYILDKFLDECKEDALINRNKIVAGLVREANAYGLDSSAAARVSAFRSLAKILGLEITKTEIDVKGAGVMLVPLGGSPDDWEKNAEKAQAALKIHARTG